MFNKLVKKGRVNVPLENKFHATPIYEFSNEYNTFDSQTVHNRSSISSALTFTNLAEQPSKLKKSAAGSENLGIEERKEEDESQV